MDATRNGTGARSRRLLGWIVGVTLVAALVWAAPPASGRASAAPAQKPNIVLILSDDQRSDTLGWTPSVDRLLAAKGVTFENAFVSNSTCCPSRTTLFTGKYSHMTGVWSNSAPTGGYGAFDDRSTIATWLQDAGYRTALIGKYLNWYRQAALAGKVPPGWDRWVAFAENNGKHTDYDLTVNGRIEPHHGDPVKDFSTDVLTSRAVSFIHQADGPLFLYFAPFAPHGPYDDVPARDQCPALKPYTSASYGEADVSDKPQYVRNASWGNGARNETDVVRAGQCALLTGVDRAVVKIVGALADTGRLSNTMIVFMSDNGFMWGEHRLFDKAKPYEEAIQIPMVVRYDPMTSGRRTESAIATNLDIAPTFAALAGVPAPGAVGRSLLPLIDGSNPAWHRDFLLEHAYDSERGENRAPDYCGLRSESWMYAMYMGGGEELYDLRSDPHEMTNIAQDRSAQATRRALHDRVLQLCDPLPPHFPEQ